MSVSKQYRGRVSKKQAHKPKEMFQMMMTAKHGTKSEKEKLKMQLAKQHPELLQKREGGGTVDTMGLISQLWGLLNSVGAAGKTDYGATNADGTLKNENKYMTGSIIGAVLDPLTTLTNDLEKGYGFWDEAKMAKQRAVLAKTKETRERANLGNKIGELANNDRLGKLSQGLANGGVVTGKSGRDTNLKQVPEQSFVIPKTGINPVVKKIAGQLGLLKPLKSKPGTTPVKLTKGEILVPPEKTKIFDKLLRVKGINGLASLAPNADNTQGFDTGGDVDTIDPHLVAIWKSLKEKGGENLEKLSPDERKQYWDASFNIYQESSPEERKKYGIAEPTGEVGIELKRQDDVRKELNKTQTDTNIISAKSDPALSTFKDNVTDLNSGKSGKKVKEDAGSNSGESFTKTGEDLGGSKNTKDAKKGNYLMESILGGAQGILGKIGLGARGDAPIVTAPPIDPFQPIQTREGLRLLKMASTYGIDPKAEAEIKKSLNETYANQVAIAKDLSGGPAETFNRASASAIAKLKAETELGVQGAGLKTQKEQKYAEALIGSEPFIASQENRVQEMNERRLFFKQHLWDQEGQAYAGLMNAGLSNAFNASRMNKFWDQYSKYSNPYATTL